MTQHNATPTTLLRSAWGEDRIARVAGEIERRAKCRKDVVAPRSKMSVTVQDDNRSFGITLANGTTTTFPVKAHALGQLAGSMGFPTRFLSDLVERGHADLVAATLSEILAREDRRHLLRTLDGNLDGFLSDRFKAVSDFALTQVVLEEAEKLGAEVWDFRLTDTSFRIHLFGPGVRARVEHAIGAGYSAAGLDKDYLLPTSTLSNSENGFGRLLGMIGALRGACSNLSVSEKALSRVHLGGRLAEGEQAIVSDETIALEEQAIVSKVRDVIRTAFNKERFEKYVKAISDTTGRLLPEEVGAVEAVDASIKAFGLPTERRERILESFLSKGRRSQYWLAQSLTEQSNPEGGAKLDDASLNAFDQAGGSLLALTGQGWKSFLRGAYKPAPEVEAEAHQHVRVAR